MITKPSAHVLNNSNNTQHKHHDSNKKGSTPTRKRTHLTRTQIASLQVAFAANPLPDAALRHSLSLSLGMTERTVQIWFQNRRAKARRVDGQCNGGGGGGGQSSNSSSNSSSSIFGETGVPHSASTQVPRYQATFRSMMTPKLFEEMNAAHIVTPTAHQTSLPSSSLSQRRPRSASKPEKPKPTQVTLAPRARSEEINHLQQQQQQQQQLQDSSRTLTTIDQSNTVPLPVHLLRIGTWTRFANMISTTDDITATATTATWDLLCYCTTNQLIWQIQAQGQQFRLQIPMEAIQQLSFGPAEDDVTGSLAQLKIQLDPQQLIFTMCLDNHQQWVRCGDFSEQKQASQLVIHEIQGYHNLLQQAVLNMITVFPELATKFMLVPSPSLDDLCRDLTVSPSATPEPSFSSMVANGSTTYSNHLTGLDKSMMIQAPFYIGPLSTYSQAATASHWY